MGTEHQDGCSPSRLSRRRLLALPRQGRGESQQHGRIPLRARPRGRPAATRVPERGRAEGVGAASNPVDVPHSGATRSRVPIPRPPSGRISSCAVDRPWVDWDGEKQEETHAQSRQTQG
jgi:hypothetical protein